MLHQEVKEHHFYQFYHSCLTKQAILDQKIPNLKKLFSSDEYQHISICILNIGGVANITHILIHGIPDQLDNNETIKNLPEYDKFRKLLRLGVPVEPIIKKMKSEDFDPTVLFS